MRRQFFRSVALLTLIGAFVLASGIRLAKSAPATLVVPDDFPTIQEAINNAVAGDTVFVKSGVYYEHVVVNKTVALVGEESSTTIVDGNGTGHVLDVVSDHVNITGLTARGSGDAYWPDLDAGFCLNGVTGCTIADNHVANNGFCGISLLSSEQNTITENSITANTDTGVYLSSSSNNTIAGNNVADNGYGMWFASSSNYNTIAGNNVTANRRDGAYLQSSSNNTITGNTIATNRWGAVSLDASDDNTIADNRVAGNRDGVELTSSSDRTRISNNTFTDNGLYVSGSYHASVQNNTVNGRPLVYLEGASDYTVGAAGQVILVRCQNIRVQSLNLSSATVGVELWETTNSAIVGNTITANDKFGIYLESAANNTISGNDVDSSFIGLYLHDSSDNTITGNNITGNSYYGVSLVYLCKYNIFAGNNISANDESGIAIGGGASSHTLITGNYIAGNHYNGIEIHDSDAIVVNNTVTDSQDGILLNCCPNASIARNVITDNAYGIHLYSSENSYIYHNTLVNNTVQLSTSPLALVDAIDDGYPSGGNYWSNYVDADAYRGRFQNETGSDGIWDHPYAADELNVDRYPLTTPFNGGLPGDVDGDRDVDIFDIVRVARVYGVTFHDPRYDWRSDLNLDGDVDIFDLVTAAGHYGQSS